MQTTSFLSIAHNKKLRCERFLDEMKAVIPWDRFINAVLPHYRSKETGRKRKNLKMMLKIYFLQQWYNLSDPGAEEGIYDRNSFQKFLEIDLLSANTVPDETTIMNFRHLLEEHQLPKKFFKIVNAILKKKNLLLTEGTIVDATIKAAPSSTKNKSKKRDPEMGSTKKGNNWRFGMKMHIGVDAKSGLVHSVTGTSASNHDKTEMSKLLHGEEKAVFGDKGYVDKEMKASCRRKGAVFWGVLDKGTRAKKLSSTQKKRNKKLSSVRAKVEHPFQVITCQWNYTKVRYRGIAKNLMQANTLFTLFNLFRVRKKLMALA